MQSSSESSRPRDWRFPESNSDSINVTITEDGVQGLVFKNGSEESSIYNYIYAPASPPSQLYLTALDGAHIGNNGSLVEGQPFTSLTLASFAVSDPSVTASSFSANVDNWGDGQGSTANVVSDGEGGFLVQGSHSYTEAGQYSIPIEIFYTPPGGPVGTLCSLHATATVSDAPLEDPTWAASLNPVANAPLSDPPLSPVTLATFTDPNPNAADSYFAAIITWQPGHQTSGTVAQVPGTDQYTVSGSYCSYGNLGPQNARVDVYDASGATASCTATVDATDGNMTTRAASIALDGLTAGTIVNVGYFKAANQAALSSDFAVTTDWRDGDVDANGFVVPTDDGGFDVYATKSTDYAGSSQPIQVTITEDSGQSGSTTATFSDNSLTVDAGSTVTVSALPSSAVVTNDGVLAFDGSGTQNFSGAISGTGVVIVSGGGTFALTGPNTYSGGTTIDAGATLQLGDGTANDNGSIVGGVVDNGTLAFDIGPATPAYAFANGISGSGSVVMVGTGTVTLVGANAYSGGTTIQSGTLAVRADDALGNQYGAVTFSGAGTLQALGNLTLAVTRPIDMSTTVADAIDTQSFNVTVPGPVSGSGGLDKTGAGTLVLNGDDSKIGGNIVVSAGVLQFGDGSGSPSTREIPQANVSFQAATPSATLAFNAPGGLVWTNGVPYSWAYDGNISGTGSLWIENSNSSNLPNDFVLGGDNTFSGMITAGYPIAGTSTGQCSLIYQNSSAVPYESGFTTGAHGVIVLGPGLTPAGTTSISSVTSPQANGSYTVGDVIDVAVTFAKPVYVSGSPELEMATGTVDRMAAYVGGNGTATLTFQYVVQPGETSPSLDYAGAGALVLNGGSIVDSSGAAVSTAMPTPGSTPSLSGFTRLAIETDSPFVDSIAPVGPATTLDGTLQFAVTFTKPVSRVTPGDCVLAGSMSGTIASVTGGGTDYFVTVTGVSGLGTLGLNLVDDDTIVDQAGNPLGGAGAGNGNFSGQAFNLVGSLPWSTAGMNFTATEGQASIGGVVATFTDSRGLYSAGDYSAQICWGDGDASTGTVDYNGTTGQFEVSGSYTYAYAGNWAIQVWISDPTGLMAVSNGTAAIADAPLTAAGVGSLAATEGAAFSETLASFVDPAPLPSPTAYGATIAWGDGQISVGTVSFNSATQQYQVAGSHVYAQYGSYSIDVTIADPGGATVDAISSMVVADAPLAAAGQYVTFTPGTAFSGSVATFTDLGGAEDPSDYTAAITWTTSQGTTTTAGSVTYDAATQQFDVGGSFTFPADTGNQISVSIGDVGGSTAMATSTPTTLAMSLARIAPTQLAPFSGAVAGFTDTDPGTADMYTATIYWGDGSSSKVTSTAGNGGQIVADANGGFDVLGSHTYLQQMPVATLSVALSGTGRTSEELSRSDIAVADAPLTGGLLTPPAAVEGTRLSPVLLYEFTDGDPNAVAGNFTAVVGWGDGSTSTVTASSFETSVGRIVANVNNVPGLFGVYGSHHLYQAAFTGGTFSVAVTDVGGATCGASDNDFGVAAPLTAGALTPPGPVGRTAFSDVPLFAFTDGYAPDSGSGLLATISWGDGTTSTATLGTSATAGDYLQETSSQSGVWVVYGSHIT